MGGKIAIWLLAFAAGAALGHIVDPEEKQRRLDAASYRSRRARLARVQQALLLSQWLNTPA
jgi:hypothetical protein